MTKGGHLLRAACLFLLGLFWGGLLLTITRLMRLDMPGPVAVSQAITPFIALTVIGVSLLRNPLPSGYIPAVILHAVIAALTVLVTTFANGWGTAVMLVLTCATGTRLLRDRLRPAPLAAGLGAGVLFTGSVLLQVTGVYAALAILAVPAVAASLLLKPIPKEAETDGPAPIPVRILLSTACGVFLGLGWVWSVLFRTLVGMTVHGPLIALAMSLAALAVGLALARGLRDRLGTIAPCLALMLAGMAIPLGFVAARWLSAGGLLASNAGAPLLGLTMCAVPACAAGVVLGILLASWPRKSKRWIYFFLPAGCAVAMGVGLVSWTWAPYGLGVLTAVLGLTVMTLPSRGGTRRALAMVALCAAVLGPVALSPYLVMPLVYSCHQLAARFADAGDIPAAIAGTYRLVYYEEYPGGFVAALKNRETLRTVCFFNGELLFPEEFYIDDIAPLFILPAVLTGRDGDVRYTGPVDPVVMSALLSAFAGNVTVVEEFPGQTAALGASGMPVPDRVRVTSGSPRRSVGGSGARVKVHLAPLPTTSASHGRYSVEFFQAARASLGVSDVFVQWVPCYKVAPETFSGILASFAQAFDAASSVWLFDHYCILVGRRSPAPLDPAVVRENFAALTDRAGLTSVEELLASFCGAADSVRDRVDSPAVRDAASWARYRLPPRREVRQIMHHNYQLAASLIADFAPLLGREPDGLTDRFRRGREVLAAAQLSWVNGNIEEAGHHVREALEINPADTLISRFAAYVCFARERGLARNERDRGQYTKALKHYALAARHRALSARDMHAAAEIYLRRADDAVGAAGYGDLRQAMAFVARALAEHPDFSRAADTGIRALLKVNLVQRARNVLEDLTQADPGYPALHELRQLVEHAAARHDSPPPPDLMDVLRAAANGLVKEPQAKVEEYRRELVSAGTDALPALQQAFASADVLGKKRVLAVMTAIGGDAVVSFVRAAMPSQSLEVQQASFDALRMYGDGDDVARLADFARLPHEAPVRSRAVIALAQMKHRAALPYLVQALGDQEPAVRREASASLKTAHAMFRELQVDNLGKDDIIRLEREAQRIAPADLLWPPFLGE